MELIKIEIDMNTIKRLYNFKVKWAELKPDQFIYSPCINCGTYNFEPLNSMVINLIEFFIVKCNRCGLIWRNPIPDKSFLKDLYAESYYNVEEHSPELCWQVGISDTKPKDKNYRWEKAKEEVLSWINKINIKPTDNSGKQQKLLEIGGGRGYLQKAASDQGWITIGVDISPPEIKQTITKGLAVFPISLEEFCERYRQYFEYFNLVVFFDFLEHVADPAFVLRIINYILTKKGKIILRIPITGGCPKLHLIDHIWHFTEKTIEQLLNREGFLIIHKHNSGIFRDNKGNEMQNITLFAQKKEL